jgi:phosphonatase-like hydrolase
MPQRTGVPALVVFDLGGTLIRDRGEVPAAFATALRASAITFDPAEITAWRGGSKRDVLAQLVGRQHVDLPSDAQRTLVAEAHDRFAVALTAQLRQAARLPIEGVVPTLERLKAAGVRVALNSGFDRAIMAMVLDIVAWPAGIFDAIVCSTDVPAGRPAPFMIFRSMEHTGVTDVRQVAIVGDTRLDLEAGANAGVAHRIGVLTGAHDRDTLVRAPYTHIVPSVTSVPDIWLGGTGHP